jgi:O-antigen ligase
MRCVTGAGVMPSLLTAVMVFSLFAPKVMSLGRKRMRLCLAAAGVAIILMWVLGAGVLGRLDREGLSGEGRVETYRSTLAIIEDHAWLGTGLGTFARVFPACHSDAESSWGTSDRAHSAPLQIAAETGVPIAAVVIASWQVRSSFSAALAIACPCLIEHRVQSSTNLTRLRLAENSRPALGPWSMMITPLLFFS